MEHTSHSDTGTLGEETPSKVALLDPIVAHTWRHYVH